MQKEQLIVIPSGVPPTQFYLTDVRRQSVPKIRKLTEINKTWPQIDQSWIPNRPKWKNMVENEAQMTPKTRQGGAPKALENHVAKKDVRGRKKYCNFW